MPRTLAAILACLALAAPALAGDIASSVDAGALAKSKATPLGLYLTPAEAHDALLKDPAIVFIDTRDPVEIEYIGHAGGVDAIVPLRLSTHEFDAKGGRYRQVDNPNFVAEVDAVMAREGRSKSDPVFLICRSGSRSAEAARKLAEAGYTNAWNLVEGFEGDRNSETGARDRNGWRNAGLPWGYKIEPRIAWPMQAGQ